MAGKFDNIFTTPTQTPTGGGKFGDIFTAQDRITISKPAPVEPVRVSVGEVVKEVPKATAKVFGGIINTFIPSIKNFFKTTGSILGEGLAYAVDPIVREQYKAGNLNILPTITATTPAKLAKDTIAAGIETAVYRSFPDIVKMKIIARGGAGILQGLGFAVAEGLAEDKKPEDIVKSLPAYGVLGGVVGVITPYLMPLLKAEMKALPQEIKGVFKGIQSEVRQLTIKKLPAPSGKPLLSVPEEKFLLQGESTLRQPEVIPLPAPREKLLLQAGVKPVSEPLKVPIYKTSAITKTTQLSKGDIVSVQGVDKFVVTEIKKTRITPRGKEQIVELKDLSGNTFEESVLDLTGAKQVRKVGEKVISPLKQPRQVVPKVKPSPIEIVKPTAEVPPTAKVAEQIIPETRTTTVPREQLPVGEGKTAVSRLEARIKEVLDEVKPANAEKAGITTYKQMNKAEQITKAVEFTQKNPEEALAVLRGDKEAPAGLLHNSIAIALEEKAATQADTNLAIKLASLRSTRAGQEISILTEVQPSNPISAIQEVIKARTERAVRKVKDVAKASTKVASEGQKVLKMSELKIAEAEKLLAEIVC